MKSLNSLLLKGVILLLASLLSLTFAITSRKKLSHVSLDGFSNSTSYYRRIVEYTAFDFPESEAKTQEEAFAYCKQQRYSGLAVVEKR